MASDILLSICIPTYNRAIYLDRCLQSIVRQVGNNPRVEVVVSDNVSIDNTSEVVESYRRQFENIKYFRNETNIGGDKNFIRVLQLGQGQYLKLLNDYVEFTEDGIVKMLDIISNYSKTREVLYFPNGVSYLKTKDFHFSNGLSEFLKIASFWSTWISSVGFWREDFHYLIQHITFKTTSFLQTELLFENVLLKKKAVTYSRQVMIAPVVVNKTTGYNFFELFIDTYLYTLILGLKKEKKISHWAYVREKNTFFINFIFYWYKRIKIKKNHSTDVTGENVEKMIFKGFKFTPIFYLYLLYLPFYLIGFYLKKLVR